MSYGHYFYTVLRYILYMIYIFMNYGHFLCKKKSRRQNFNSTAPYQTVRALLRHTAYQCELNFRKVLNVEIQFI